jgi:SPP1 gp7 family putative phage head morphogenesis protein
MIRSTSYWVKRAEATMDLLQEAADERLRLIGKVMYNAQKQLAKDAQRIFQRFASRFDLTEAEARAALLEPVNAMEYKLLKAKLAQLPAGVDRLAAEIRLNSGAYAARISRIEALQQNIAIETAKVSRLLEDELTGQLRFTAVEGYGRTTYELQVRTGSAFTVPDIRGFKIAIDSVWAGANFSTRIWGKQATLASDLKELITSGYLGGESNASVARKLMERFSVSFRDAERLVRTETSYIAGQSAKKAYEDAGIETYRYKTAWDSRTCKFCAPLDGQTFPVSEAAVGVNYPPIHPNCRCTTAAAGIVEIPEYKTRRNFDGTVVQIPGNMNYGEWMKWQEAGAPVDIKGWRTAA